jgi:hypothetical protein
MFSTLFIENEAVLDGDGSGDDGDNVGRAGVVYIATRNGLDGPWIESQYGGYFPHPSLLSLGPTLPLIQ